MEDQSKIMIRPIRMEEIPAARRIGYQIATRLFEFARSKGYKRIRLQTGHEQGRAIAFYHRLGFFDIPSYSDEAGEISMEIGLQDRANQNIFPLSIKNVN